MSKQPKALELAEQLENYWLGPSLCSVKAPAAALLRTQRQQIKELCEALATTLRYVDFNNRNAPAIKEASTLLSRIKEQQ